MRKCSCGRGNMAFSCKIEREGEREKQLEKIVFVLFLLLKAGGVMAFVCMMAWKIAKSSINYLQVMLKFKRLIAFRAFEFSQER